MLHFQRGWVDVGAEGVVDRVAFGGVVDQEEDFQCLLAVGGQSLQAEAAAGRWSCGFGVGLQRAAVVGWRWGEASARCVDWPLGMNGLGVS